jgi:gliding motility-associated protein GldM
MAGYKETPRQKMIGMLYLVLTALLALNVSKDILDAFMVVNDSMENTNQNFSTKIAGTYAQFENQYQIQPGKVGEYWEKAQEVRQRSNDLIDYIEELKLELVSMSEKKSKEETLELFYSKASVADPFNPGQQREINVLNLDKVPSRDKFDVPTALMIGQNKNGKAYELSAKMDEYRNFILGVIGEQFADRIGLITNREEGYRDATGTLQDWQQYNFYHTILAASVTIKNKIIGEVQSAEFDAINRLYANITEEDFKFDEIKAEVIPKSTYILTGQNYEADVLVAAYDSKVQSEAWVVRGADQITTANRVSAQTITSVDGIIKLQFPATSTGVQRYAGIIEMFNPATQSFQEYPFSAEYVVAPPALTVAPLRMNIFYAGVQNPISISSPGISLDAIRPVISDGTITKNPDGTWFVEINEDIRTTTISASATIDGRTIALGSQEFRIKRVPPPIARIANMTDGAIDRNVLLAADAIIPVMEDFDFEGYNFTIQSYTVTTFRGGDVAPLGTITGNRFNDVVRNEIRNARRGQRIYFENIRATGPGGVVRQLNPVNLQIN